MKKTLSAIFAMAVVTMSCSRQTAPVAVSDGLNPVVIGAGESYMPKAEAFRMSGDFADNVAVTLAADGTLSYFPAPSDISADSAPVYLGNGWWLNRQGFGANAVFTSWTFKEYAAMPATPSANEIMAHIIPGAVVTETFRTKVPAASQMQNLDRIKAELPIANAL